jgi:pyrimidine operon attenuation protein/uracil phosphoribosyltransferase
MTSNDNECDDVPGLLQILAAQLRANLLQRALRDPAMIGIHTGGLWVARYLHEALGIVESLGSLDISFYRDDFTRIGIHPDVRPSVLPFEVEDRHIILVDDVLHTGRTIRAALNEIFDYGRPASVTLAVLVYRDGHELPIAADATGHRIKLPAGAHIKLSGPEPLTLTVHDNR